MSRITAKFCKTNGWQKVLAGYERQVLACRCRYLKEVVAPPQTFTGDAAVFAFLQARLRD